MNSSKHKSLDVEDALLGMALSDNTYIEQIVTFLNQEDFTNPINKKIFNYISENNGDQKNFDLTLLSEQISKDAKEKEVILKHIFNLVQNPGYKSSFNSYLQIISSNTTLRNLETTTKNVYEKLKTGDKEIDKDTIISNLQDTILKIDNRNVTKNFENIYDVFERVYTELENKKSGQVVTGLKTNLKALDDITTGFQKGDLIIIAARPSMGKTAFALNIASQVSEKHSVAFFSFEMPNDQLASRLISIKSSIDGYKLKKPELLSETEWTKIQLVGSKFGNSKLFIDDSSSLKLNELVWKAKKLKNSSSGLDMIIIDYLQLINMNSNKDDRQQEVSKISRTLKQLARELEVPVIALSQLSRKVEQREDKRPMMSDLRESGAIEQDADLILFLYREDYYGAKNLNQEETEVDITEVNIAKHRNGSTGTIKLCFKAKAGQFINLNDVEGGQ